jgi:uncharacterized protein YbbK (DUF523 family)
MSPDHTDPRPLFQHAVRGRTLAVSACLLGEDCRYDGASKPSQAVRELVSHWLARDGRVVPICPEQLGGLPTPRPAADLRGGDGHAVLDARAAVRRVADHGDVTDAFVAGARRAAELAGPDCFAVLKARSPSCGVGQTEIDGALGPGDGVLAALLRRRGIPVCTEEQLGPAKPG